MLPPHLQKPRLRRWEASEYLSLVYGLQVAAQTLAKYASQGGGPAFNLAGRVPLYPTVLLDEWALARLGTPVSNTAEAARLRA